jgi:hypothetical protein
MAGERSAGLLPISLSDAIPKNSPEAAFAREIVPFSRMRIHCGKDSKHSSRNRYS